MRDIGTALTVVMRDEKCSPVRAFFLLSEVDNGIRELQSKSSPKVSRRLRDKSNFQNTK